MTERPLLPADDAVTGTGEHQDPDTVGLGASRPSKQPQKQDEIRSFAELLTYAYARTGKQPFSITPKVRKALAGDPTDIRMLADQIIRLGPSDPLLAVPPKMLIAMERASLGGRPREKLLRLMALAVGQHPSLASIDFAATLSDDPAPDIDELLPMVRRALQRVEPGRLEKGPLRTPDRRALRDNAILSVALLLAIKHDWTTMALADCLDAHLWQENLAATKIPSERAILADGTSPVALALVARAWRERLTKQARKAVEAEAELRGARRRWQEALRRADELAQAKEQVENELAQRGEVIASLQRELASEREHRRIEKSHAIDDYESLRSQLVRGLVQQISLLEDALHALRHERVAVTDEYVERVIDSLREDLQRLRDGINKDRGV